MNETAWPERRSRHRLGMGQWVVENGQWVVGSFVSRFQLYCSVWQSLKSPGHLLIV